MKNERAIRKLSRALRSEYGRRIREILVFGSVARGTDTAASDIDVLVIFNSDAGPVNWQLERTIRDVAFPIELQEDVVFDLKAVAEHDLRGLRGHTPFMERVTSEGVAV